MSGAIFFLGDTGELVRLEEHEWSRERDFQDLLALHPDLLGADQMDVTDPPRWLHVKRETAVPDSEEQRSRWSVDHLFLDQHGIPTLVEVKRSSDTRLRREVVGQMLDYAANSAAYWSIEQIQLALERRCAEDGLDPDDEVRSVLESDVGLTEFWTMVKTNLHAGRIRMLFVADEIPPELHRIVEFLNEQMDPAQVLAVEVKRFSADGRWALVPRVLGQTAESETRKSVRTRGHQWNEASVFAELEERVSEPEVALARRALAWAKANDLKVTYGTGKAAGSFSPRVEIPATGDLHPTFHVYTDGKVEHPFANMKTPFDTLGRRADLAADLEDAVPGLIIQNAMKRPSIPLVDLVPHADSWFAVWDSFVEETRRTMQS